MQRFTYKIGAQGARDRARRFMGNDIVRGIVELITNSDAAYTAQGASRPQQRPIAVAVNAAARYIEVRDRAGGMSPKVVRDKFTEGGATSEEGQRGYFGLGAKDCAAFGSLIVKTIDGEGSFSEVRIPGDFENCEWESRKATDGDYKEIHGASRRRTGAVVRIGVNSAKEGGTSLPRFQTLIQDLRTHYALRSLHERNSVNVITEGGAKKQNQHLVYPGSPWESNIAERVHEGTLDIESYPDSRPHLRLFKLQEPVPGSTSSETFEGFILVGTDGIADYGFTLAGLENRDHAKRLVGRLNDPYIQDLLKDYRQRGPSELNPRPVVDQDRRPNNGGLDSSHPYAKALVDALRPILQAALAQIQAESRSSERVGISEALETANEEAGRQLSQILDAAGETPLTKPLPSGFYFLPQSKALARSRTNWETISLYWIPESPDKAPIDKDAILTLEGDDVCVLEASAVALRRRLGDNQGYRASIKLQAIGKLGRATLTASLDGDIAAASILVGDTPTPPLLFDFERSRYTVQPSSRRIVKLVLPEALIDDVADMDPTVRLSISAASDGVVIRGPQSRSVFDCTFDTERVAYLVPFQLEGRQVGARAILKATFQDHHAEAAITVGGGAIRVFLDDNATSPPDERAKVYEEDEACTAEEHHGELCLHVFARHPRINPYLGEPNDSPNGIFWDLNDSPGFRAMYADCIAEAVAHYQVTHSDSPESPSLSAVLSSLWEAKKKALAVMHRIYIDDAAWKSQQEYLGLDR